MKADPKVIEHLTTRLTNVLTPIDQYVLHARVLRHRGVTKLGAHEYSESIEEMHHADRLIERILFLGGLANVRRLNQVMVGQTVEGIRPAALAPKDKATADLREGIAHVESFRDFVSRDLLLKILANEEEYVDFLDCQFDLMKPIWIERYILLNSAAAPDQA